MYTMGTMNVVDVIYVFSDPDGDGVSNYYHSEVNNPADARGGHHIIRNGFER